MWLLKRLAQISSSLLYKDKLWLTTLFCVLASKTKKQIFVSYNLQNTDSNFTLLIENRIKEEMTAFPEKFWLCILVKEDGGFVSEKLIAIFTLTLLVSFVLFWLNLWLLLNIDTLDLDFLFSNRIWIFKANFFATLPSRIANGCCNGWILWILLKEFMWCLASVQYWDLMANQFQMLSVQLICCVPALNIV